MSSENTMNVTSLKLSIPISFLKESVKKSESGTIKQSEMLWKGQMPNEVVPCKVSTTRGILDTPPNTKNLSKTPLLMISISEVELKVADGHLHCMLSSVEKVCKLGKKSEVNITTESSKNELVGNASSKTSDDRNEPVLKNVETGVKSALERTPQIKNTVDSFLNKNENNLEENTPRRYSLRGAKLSKTIMESEKNVSKSGDIKPKCLKRIPKHPSDDININDDDPDYKQVESDAERDHDEDDDEDSKIGKKRKRHAIDYGDVPKFERRRRSGKLTAECKYCKRHFVDYTGVDDHVKRFHTDQEDVDVYLQELVELKKGTCKICGATFNNRYQLHDHEDRIHLKAGGMKCHVCDKTYKNLACLRMHIKVVHVMAGKNVHACELCSAKFKWSVTLKHHIEEVHEGVKPHACKVCGKKFYRKSGLNRHEKIHGLDESKKLFCSQCGKWFWFGSNLKRHIKVMHEASEGEKYHCSYCGKGFNLRTKLLAHVQHVHFVLPVFTCEICKETFKRSKAYEEHMAKFHDQVNFKIVTSRPEHFKYNRTPDDLLYCSYCSESFCYKAKLVEHMHFTHSDAFPFKCELCNQGYLERNFLKTHLRKAHPNTVQVGNNENTALFECERCDKDFSDKTLLDSHVETVHSINKEIHLHKCNLCKKIFTENCNLESHILKEHVQNVGAESEAGHERLLVLTDAAGSLVEDQSVSTNQVVMITEGSHTPSQMMQLDTDTESFVAQNSSEGTPVVVKVTDGEDTIHYVIQHPGMSDNTEDTVSIAQDIANLLFSAGPVQTAEETVETSAAIPDNAETIAILTGMENTENATSESEICINSLNRTVVQAIHNAEPDMTGNIETDEFKN